MPLISVFIKKVMKKENVSKNSTPILDVLYHRLTSKSTLQSVYINIIQTLFLI